MLDGPSFLDIVSGLELAGCIFLSRDLKACCSLGMNWFFLERLIVVNNLNLLCLNSYVLMRVCRILFIAFLSYLS
jgi:hypothetical protein